MSFGIIARRDVTNLLSEEVRQHLGIKPKRIQRKRTKGWRMPLGAMYVGRPTKWGNPYVLRESRGPNECHVETAELAVTSFRKYLTMLRGPNWLREYLTPLRGKDLVCWCNPDQPCHADVLLELANK